MSCHRRFPFRISGAVGLVVACTLGTGAQAQARARAVPNMTEEQPGLLMKAHVTADSARSIAMRRLPSSRIDKSEIEMEGGKLVYSFDMKTRGRRGIDEILVDAMSGAIISVEHEGAAQEAADKSHDARERKASTDSTRRP